MSAKRHGPIPYVASGRLFREALDRAYLRELEPREYPPSTSIILLEWCDTCNEWMLEGSAAAGHCVTCGTSR